MLRGVGSRYRTHQWYYEKHDQVVMKYKGCHHVLRRGESALKLLIPDHFVYENTTGQLAKTEERMATKPKRNQ